MIRSVPRLRARRAASLLLAGLLAAGALAACSSDDLPPPTAYSLTLAASEQINPQGNGEPAPVVVRIYQLADTGAFLEKTFFELYDDPAKALGSDLLARSEYTVVPGSTVNAEVTGPREVRYVGVIAAFRDIEAAQWRISRPIEAGNDNRLIIGIEALQISFLTPDRPLWQRIFGLAPSPPGAAAASAALRDAT